MHGRCKAAQFIETPCGHEEAERKLALRFLVERPDNFAEVVYLRIGCPRTSTRIE